MTNRRCHAQGPEAAKAAETTQGPKAAETTERPQAAHKMIMRCI